MSAIKTTSAFGIEPGRKPYRLRLAKYYGIGETIHEWSRRHGAGGRKLAIVDVGGDEGRVFRYVSAFLGEEGFHGTVVDAFPKGMDRVYEKERRSLVQCDLEEGLPMLETGSFDVVICEQVLEHLRHPERVIAEMYRVARPGGLAFMGVPSFPPGLRWLRGSVVPWWDRRRGVRRDHVQAFSLGSFTRLVTSSALWQVVERRGYRIVSGWPLQSLEHYRWWWRTNRWLGSKVPTLCIEVQLVLHKPE